VQSPSSSHYIHYYHPREKMRIATLHRHLTNATSNSPQSPLVQTVRAIATSLVSTGKTTKPGRREELATPAYRRSDLSAADMRHARSVLEKKTAYIVDCDGVIYHANRLLPGAREFVRWLHNTRKNYVFLTNSSDKTPKEMAEKFAKLGLDFVDDSHFFTSAMATASFLAHQKGSGARAFFVGHDALRQALNEKGIVCVGEQSAEMSNPDFVVMGETSSAEVYNYDVIALAIKLVRRGSRLIGTNEDLADRVGAELHPGTGAMILPVAAVCGTEPYFVGKPNPIMVVNALERLQSTRESTIFIGDRMNTDIRAGVEAQVDTCLVLSGVTSENDVARFSYRPSTILNGVGDIPAILGFDADAYVASEKITEQKNSGA